jgi:hypothetical protein
MDSSSPNGEEVICALVIPNPEFLHLTTSQEIIEAILQDQDILSEPYYKKVPEDRRSGSHL